VPIALQTQLDAFKAAFAARVDRSLNERIESSILDAQHRLGGKAAVGPGDAFPTVTDLRDSEGKAFDLARLINDGPAIILMFRGGWCPYCNLTLRAYQSAAADIGKRGAQLIAIAPERPNFLQETAERNDVTFPLLSDSGGALAKKLGIDTTLPEFMRPVLEKAGYSLPRRNGDESWQLPFPAVYVVEKGGRISDAFVDPDYRKRLEPTEAFGKLSEMLLSGR
jgi:peroxiredoxin